MKTGHVQKHINLKRSRPCKMCSGTGFKSRELVAAATPLDRYSTEGKPKKLRVSCTKCHGRGRR